MYTTTLLLLSLSFLAWISGAHPSPSQISSDTTKIMDTIFRNYDKRIRPNFQDKPVDVTISAYILDIYNVNELSHQFTVNMYLRHQWVDPRLTYMPPAGVEYILLDPNESKKIWTPDTFFVNERQASIHSFSTLNEFLRIKPDGMVIRSTRVTITASCIMNLKWFPFDRHTCSLDLESYGYSAKDIKYMIAADKIGVSKETQASIQFSIEAIRVTNSSTFLSQYTQTYSKASIEILIKRNPLRYLQDIYFPAIVLPLIAFITLSTGSLQSRVHLSVLCMVAMVIFQALLSAAMPKVSYQTALDFYVFNSAVMIFNVVIANFLVYHLMRPSSADDKMPLTQANGNADDSVGAGDIPSDFKLGPPRFSSRTKGIISKMLEKNKYTTPLFFVLFNIIYWPVVLIASSTFPEDFILLEDHSV